MDIITMLLVFISLIIISIIYRIYTSDPTVCHLFAHAPNNWSCRGVSVAPADQLESYMNGVEIGPERSDESIAPLGAGGRENTTGCWDDRDQDYR